VDRERLPVEIRDQIDIDSFRLDETFSGSVELERKIGRLDPQGEKDPQAGREEDREPLSAIIQELNDRFGMNLTERDRLSLETLTNQLAEDPALDAAARANTRENVRYSFQEKAIDLFQETAKSNFDFYKRATDDRQFGERLFDLLFEEFWRRKGA
jgi:type I restriction enzyme, R subunit